MLKESPIIKSWDRILAPLVGLGALLIPRADGLEVLSGGSAGFSVPVKVLALLVIVAGNALDSNALYENRFFSSVERIQADRGQTVISEGPCRLMRHPGYGGALATCLAVPFFLYSLWVFVPALHLVIVLVIHNLP